MDDLCAVDRPYAMDSTCACAPSLHRQCNGLWNLRSELVAHSQVGGTDQLDSWSSRNLLQASNSKETNCPDAVVFGRTHHPMHYRHTWDCAHVPILSVLTILAVGVPVTAVVLVHIQPRRDLHNPPDITGYTTPLTTTNLLRA